MTKAPIIPLAIIASFPPPVAGQSLATQILVEGLKNSEAHRFTIYPLNLAEAVGGDVILKRLAKLGKLAFTLSHIAIKERKLIVYLQLGHGQASILRDSTFLALTQLFRKRAIVHVHGSGYRDALKALPKPVRSLHSYLIRKVKKAIVLSDSLQWMFEGLIAPDRIVSVGNGIEPAIEALAESFKRVDKRHNQPLRILFLSNLLRSKGIDTFLEAACMAHAQQKPWEFVVVGPFIEGNGFDVEAFIASHNLGNVVWKGALFGKEKAQVYMDCDIFCLPSHYEGQPLCILEAMHFGMPVIATKVGGIPDIFASPDDALFMEVGDSEAIIKHVEALESDADRMKELQSQSMQRARRHFSSQAHTQNMLALFDSVFLEG